MLKRVIPIILILVMLCSCSGVQKVETEPYRMETMYDTYEGNGFSFKYDASIYKVSEVDGSSLYKLTGLSDRRESISIHKAKASGQVNSILSENMRKMFENTGQYQYIENFTFNQTYISDAAAVSAEFDAALRYENEDDTILEPYHIVSYIIECPDGEQLTIVLKESPDLYPFKSEVFSKLLESLTV